MITALAQHKLARLRILTLCILILSVTTVCAQIDATFSFITPSCATAADGKLCCETITGGTPPYTCSIIEPYGTYNPVTNCFDNMPSGIYHITITDALQVSGSAIGFVGSSSIPAITVTETVIPSGCGAADGSICCLIGGGSGSFTFYWYRDVGTILLSTGTILSGQTTCISSLIAGDYTLILDDNNTSCGDIFSVNVPSAILTATAQTYPATCTAPCNGYISVDLSNATLPVTVSWTGTSSGSVSGINTTPYLIQGLCPGTYSVTVDDASTCQPVTINSQVIGLDSADIIITGCNNPVWNPQHFLGQTDVTLGGNLIIAAGACLEIQNMTIRLQPGRFIRIMGTGTLTATNSIFDAGCGDWWQGFEVSSLQPNTNSANRGTLNMSANCKITHAIIGICNFQNNGAPVTFTSGGQMEVSDTQFIDNNVDLSLRSYYPSGTLTAQNRGGHFENCTFELYNYVAGATAATLIGQARVQMMNIADLHFRNCRAENFNPAYLSINNGGNTKTFATASYANFVWNGCSTDGSICNNSFIKGYVNGFRCSGDLTVGSPTAGNVFFGPIISNTNFECYRGVYTSTVSALSITDNTFKLFNFPNTVLPPGYFYAANIAYAASNQSVFNPAPNLGTNFLFAGNNINFHMPTGSLGNMQSGYATGILVYNAGEHSNYIIKNTFKGCARAGQFDDRNKGSDFNGFNATIGLHYECNTLDTCQLDFVIRDPLGVEGDDAGVFGLQRRTFDSPLTTFSAGNKFTASISNSNQDDIANGIPITSSTHRYVYHSNELNANGITEMSPAIQNLISTLNENDCDYNYSEWTSVISNGQLIAPMSNYTQTRDIYLTLVDGGNSTNVKGRVENISLAQALTLYQDLLALSPNLSEEVMAKLVQKEQEFPATLLTMVLASNPSAVKSAMIQKALSERNTPLNSYQTGLIAAGWNGSSPKELLESEML